MGFLYVCILVGMCSGSRWRQWRSKCISLLYLHAWPLTYIQISTHPPRPYKYSNWRLVDPRTVVAACTLWHRISWFRSQIYFTVQVMVLDTLSPYDNCTLVLLTCYYITVYIYCSYCSPKLTRKAQPRWHDLWPIIMLKYQTVKLSSFLQLITSEDMDIFSDSMWSKMGIWGQTSVPEVWCRVVSHKTNKLIKFCQNRRRSCVYAEWTWNDP